MFMRVLQCYVASTVLLLRPFASFMEVADSRRLMEVIFEDRCVEMRSAASVA